ncbi:MAG: hypothetical protein VB959_07440 [Rhodospirillales bacterium]
MEISISFWMISSTRTTPAAPAAASPQACNPSMGASITGIAILWPRKSMQVSTLETSRSTRGRKARLSRAWRLRRRRVSVSAPPQT